MRVERPEIKEGMRPRTGASLAQRESQPSDFLKEVIDKRRKGIKMARVGVVKCEV